MNKFSRNFRLPADVVEWLDQYAQSNRTELVVFAVRLLSEIDRDKLENLAKDLQVRPSLLMGAALNSIDSLSPDQQDELLADYIKKRRK